MVKLNVLSGISVTGISKRLKGSFSFFFLVPTTQGAAAAVDGLIFLMEFFFLGKAHRELF